MYPEGHEQEKLPLVFTHSATPEQLWSFRKHSSTSMCVRGGGGGGGRGDVERELIRGVKIVVLSSLSMLIPTFHRNTETQKS